MNKAWKLYLWLKRLQRLYLSTYKSVRHLPVFSSCWNWCLTLCWLDNSWALSWEGLSFRGVNRPPIHALNQGPARRVNTYSASTYTNLPMGAACLTNQGLRIKSKRLSICSFGECSSLAVGSSTHYANPHSVIGYAECRVSTSFAMNRLSAVCAIRRSYA